MTKKKTKTQLDFEIDKLTNSIVNVISGEEFKTTILIVTLKDLTKIRKEKWKFNWTKEFKSTDRTVYKLETVENPGIVHGLISLKVRPDHVEMTLIENSPFNFGSKKLYHGVAGNLVAFGCKIAFESGFEGILAFTAKSRLIDHYKKTLNAQVFKGNDMYIDTKFSLSLVKKYFKDFEL
jgi:hypothetical protein